MEDVPPKDKPSSLTLSSDMHPTVCKALSSLSTACSNKVSSDHLNGLVPSLNTMVDRRGDSNRKRESSKTLRSHRVPSRKKSSKAVTHSIESSLTSCTDPLFAPSNLPNTSRSGKKSTQEKGFADADKESHTFAFQYTK